MASLLIKSSRAYSYIYASMPLHILLEVQSLSLHFSTLPTKQLLMMKPSLQQRHCWFARTSAHAIKSRRRRQCVLLGG